MTWKQRQPEQDAINGLIAGQLAAVAAYAAWLFVAHFLIGGMSNGMFEQYRF